MALERSEPAGAQRFHCSLAPSSTARLTEHCPDSPSALNDSAALQVDRPQAVTGQLYQGLGCMPLHVRSLRRASVDKVAAQSKHTGSHNVFADGCARGGETLASCETLHPGLRNLCFRWGKS